MTLFAIISNLFLITNLIALPIGDNYYYQQNAIEEGGIFFNIKSEELNQKSKFPLKVINDSFLPNYLVKNRINFNEWFK